MASKTKSSKTAEEYPSLGPSIEPSSMNEDENSVVIENEDHIMSDFQTPILLVDSNLVPGGGQRLLTDSRLPKSKRPRLENPNSQSSLIEPLMLSTVPSSIKFLFDPTPHKPLTGNKNISWYNIKDGIVRTEKLPPIFDGQDERFFQRMCSTGEKMTEEAKFTLQNAFKTEFTKVLESKILNSDTPNWHTLSRHNYKEEKHNCFDWGWPLCLGFEISDLDICANLRKQWEVVASNYGKPLPNWSDIQLRAQANTLREVESAALLSLVNEGVVSLHGIFDGTPQAGGIPFEEEAPLARNIGTILYKAGVQKDHNPELFILGPAGIKGRPCMVIATTAAPILVDMDGIERDRRAGYRMASLNVSIINKRINLLEKILVIDDLDLQKDSHLQLYRKYLPAMDNSVWKEVVEHPDLVLARNLGEPFRRKKIIGILRKVQALSTDHAHQTEYLGLKGVCGVDYWDINEACRTEKIVQAHVQDHLKHSKTILPPYLLNMLDGGIILELGTLVYNNLLASTPNIIQASANLYLPRFRQVLMTTIIDSFPTIKFLNTEYLPAIEEFTSKNYDQRISVYPRPPSYNSDKITKSFKILSPRKDKSMASIKTKETGNLTRNSKEQSEQRTSIDNLSHIDSIGKVTGDIKLSLVILSDETEDSAHQTQIPQEMPDPMPVESKGEKYPVEHKGVVSAKFGDLDISIRLVRDHIKFQEILWDSKRPILSDEPAVWADSFLYKGGSPVRFHPDLPPSCQDAALLYFAYMRKTIDETELKWISPMLKSGVFDISLYASFQFKIALIAVSETVVRISEKYRSTELFWGYRLREAVNYALAYWVSCHNPVSGVAPWGLYWELGSHWKIELSTPCPVSLYENPTFFMARKDALERTPTLVWDLTLKGAEGIPTTLPPSLELPPKKCKEIEKFERQMRIAFDKDERVREQKLVWTDGGISNRLNLIEDALRIRNSRHLISGTDCFAAATWTIYQSFRQASQKANPPFSKNQQGRILRIIRNELKAYVKRDSWDQWISRSMDSDPYWQLEKALRAFQPIFENPPLVLEVSEKDDGSSSSNEDHVFNGESDYEEPKYEQLKQLGDTKESMIRGNTDVDSDSSDESIGRDP